MNAEQDRQHEFDDSRKIIVAMRAVAWALRNGISFLGVIEAAAGQL